MVRFASVEREASKQGDFSAVRAVGTAIAG